MTTEELNTIYSKWTGQLHVWVTTQLGRQIDCEYNPQNYTFRLYSGRAIARLIRPGQTVPAFVRPAGERTEVFQLPRPESNPSYADLGIAFRSLCLGAARILQIDVSKRQLEDL
jgi:hypothetical protein